jgi:hypothetical protein
LRGRKFGLLRPLSRHRTIHRIVFLVLHFALDFFTAPGLTFAFLSFLACQKKLHPLHPFVTSQQTPAQNIPETSLFCIIADTVCSDPCVPVGFDLTRIEITIEKRIREEIVLGRSANIRSVGVGARTRSRSSWKSP